MQTICRVNLQIVLSDSNLIQGKRSVSVEKGGTIALRFQMLENICTECTQYAESISKVDTAVQDALICTDLYRHVQISANMGINN